MDILSIHQCPQDSVDGFLSSIPFYREIKQQDQWQYDLLMRHSKLIEYRPNEVVLEKGQTDQWLFFLLKGRLQVVVGDSAESRVVNEITPGEVFGDLALLFNHVRTATVKADPSAKKILVFGTNFNVFGKVTDCSLIKLSTKLLYYRNMVHNLRWKLEMYRSTYPENDFSSEHRKVKLYSGPKNTIEELKSLDEQARQYAKLLVAWNNLFDEVNTVPNPLGQPSSLHPASR